LVVVPVVLRKHQLEMPPGDDEDMVETVLADGPHPALGKGVGARRLHGRAGYLGTDRREDGITQDVGPGQARFGE
jgi:hypothetical protein